MELYDAPLDQAILDDLWDFHDAPLSARRFHVARIWVDGAGPRDELTTQEARALGLQGRYPEAAKLLDGLAASSNPAVVVRCLLERGRLHNSAGQPADAVPLFQEAVDRALESALIFLAIDSLHMLGIADPATIEETTARALALLAETGDSRTKRWAVSLHNNLGWALHDQGRYVEALEEFESAHAASRQNGTVEQEFAARWALARCLRSLGRDSEALTIQERLAIENPEDEYVVEELQVLRSRLTPPA